MTLHYRNGELFIEDVAIEDIVEEVPTPFYVYSERQLRANIQEFKRATRYLRGKILFSVKANPHPHILTIMGKMGLGAETYSREEWEISKWMDPIVFTSPWEEPPDGTIVSSPTPVEGPWIIRVKSWVPVPRMFRHKWGVPLAKAMRYMREYPNAIGIHIHVGSQMEDPHAYEILAQKLCNVNVPLVDVGGGFPVDYDGKLPGIDAYIRPLECLKDREVWIEPGRRLVGSAGHLVMAVKKRDNHRIWVNGGLHTFSGVVYYGERHRLLPSREGAGILKEVRGASCEGWDIWGKMEDNGSPFMVVKDTGAYGRSLSFHYHRHPLPAEVWVKGRRFEIITPVQPHI